MKQVLIYSIQPEHVLNFLRGLKNIEVRKRDLPQWAKDKIDRGEIVEGYGYCTKGGKRLVYEKQPKHPYYMLSNSDGVNSGNGKVVVKFQVSGVTQFEFVENNLTVKYDNEAQLLGKVYMLNEQATQLTYEQLFKYIGNNKGYAHHFTNVQPVNMKLGEFMFIRSKLVMYKNSKFFYEPVLFHDVIDGKPQGVYKLTKSPQSFQSVWVKGE